MQLMDTDNDGKVSWEEFLKTMTDWLQDVQPSLKRKRSFSEVNYTIVLY